MNIEFVRLKIDGFPNIPSFQHSIIDGFVKSPIQRIIVIPVKTGIL